VTQAKDQDVIATLLQVLHQNGAGALLPTPQRPGLLARLFDRGGAARDDFAYRQLLVMLETELKALQVETEGYVKTVQLTTDSKVQVHERKLAHQEAVLMSEAEGLAVIDLHTMQQRLIEKVAGLALDPKEEAFVIAKIVAACMGKPKENHKENQRGHK
jgi:hypothetical protein